MKTLIISILTLAITNSFSQVKDSCFHEIKKSEWNFSICMDKHMAVDASNESELLIKQYEFTENETKTRQVSITLQFNYENNTEQELWNSQFSEQNIEGLILLNRKDSVLISGETNFISLIGLLKTRKRKSGCCLQLLGDIKISIILFRL